MVLVGKVLDVLELAPGFGVTVVGHTSKSAVGNGFEITVASHGGVVLVDFLVAVL